MLKIGGIYREVESEDTDNHYFIIVDIFDSNYFVVDIKEDLPFANNQMIQEIVSKEVKDNLVNILIFSWEILIAEKYVDGYLGQIRDTDLKKLQKQLWKYYNLS